MLRALALTTAQLAARHMAVLRLHAVSAEMAHVNGLLRSHADPQALAGGDLACAARLGWARSQAALIQADAGMVCERMIDEIADRRTAPAPLQALRLSCLAAAEARLLGRSPRPVAREARA